MDFFWGGEQKQNNLLLKDSSIMIFKLYDKSNQAVRLWYHSVCTI